VPKPEKVVEGFSLGERPTNERRDPFHVVGMGEIGKSPAALQELRLAVAGEAFHLVVQEKTGVPLIIAREIDHPGRILRQQAKLLLILAERRLCFFTLLQLLFELGQLLP